MANKNIKISISQSIKNFYHEFIYGGHLLSLGGAFGFVGSIIIILDLPFAWEPILIVYLISQIIYSYDHFKGIKEDILTNPERGEYLEKKAAYLPFINFLYLFFLFLITMIHANRGLLFFVLFLIFGGILYSIILKNLTKKIPCFKNIYVSLFWALTIFIPLFYYSLSFSYFFVLFFCFIFLRLVTNTTFFDIKDIDSDKIKKLKTLPVSIGKKRTINYLNLINILSFTPLLVGILIGEITFFAITLFALYFYSLYYLIKAYEASPQWVRKISYLMVDGEYYFWPILLLLSKSII